ncbi:MAG: hypothetical protein IIB77_11075 [Proteobacteria bacterium]|nr:hypothetical protein [Pseudomonadota bacterium]
MVYSALNLQSELVEHVRAGAKQLCAIPNAIAQQGRKVFSLQTLPDQLLLQSRDRRVYERTKASSRLPASSLPMFS